MERKVKQTRGWFKPETKLPVTFGSSTCFPFMHTCEGFGISNNLEKYAHLYDKMNVNCVLEMWV